MAEEVTCQVVWGRVTAELGQSIVDYWRSIGLTIPEGQDAAQRARQVAVVAHNDKGQIVGVCSVYKRLVPQFKNHFYKFRSSVAEPYRRSGLAMKLFNRVYQELNKGYKAEDKASAIGIMVDFENQYLNTTVLDAVSPRLGLIFVGYNNKGQQTRVRYFDGARVL